MVFSLSRVKKSAMDKQPTPYYRLKDLIAKKYGTDRLALGYEIVARWVAFETNKDCTMERIQFWCNLKTEEMPEDVKSCVGMLMGWNEAKALMKLFGLNHSVELLTPVNLKQ